MSDTNFLLSKFGAYIIMTSQGIEVELNCPTNLPSLAPPPLLRSNHHLIYPIRGKAVAITAA